MNIEFIEAQNFRKLKSIRIDFTKKTTVFVGANNSGKTSAMVVLGHFLIDSNRFSTKDFTLSNWGPINRIGAAWEAQAAQAPAPSISEWADLLPSMDVWLQVANDEVHYVSHLLPTLDWAGGLLGVRLRFEPKNVAELCKDYVSAAKAASETKASASGKQGGKYKVLLWPTTMEDFLERRLGQHFGIRAYSLDPTKCRPPEKGIAKPQQLPAGSEPIDGDPLNGLIRVDEINAQRGFGDATTKRDVAGHDGQESRTHREKRKLSEQLRSYYAKHLDPADLPEPSDLDALEAIATAQAMFDDKLKTGFSAALKEVEELGYPGVTDPKLIVSTRLHPIDGLNHDAAVQYEISSQTGEQGSRPLRLPEEYNGLGYQNLISMIFKLMGFRDAWMKVGKAGKKAPTASDSTFPSPLHLVLVEEPEAHLHAQVQQVFIRKAYDVLRKHEDLGAKAGLQTQLVISTHSSHIAHECEFASLRYFRRLPADAAYSVPTSAVVNLSEVFGKPDQTQQFVTRYLKATHCDLFFADAAILVEGPAERMLVPHFIRNRFNYLSQRYVTLLEIGGSHAHRLQSLIEHLGLTTLVITDLDAADAAGAKHSIVPARGKAHITRNSTLKSWIPVKTLIDDLINPSVDKVKTYDPLFSIRVAYQVPIQVQLDEKAGTAEAISNTFEDALVFENLALFKTLGGDGLISSFREAIAKSKDPNQLEQTMFASLKGGDKAKFALDLLLGVEPDQLKVPTYINEGLSWLEEQLKRRQVEILSPDVAQAGTLAPTPLPKVIGKA